MRRRLFIGSLGATAAWPLAARAQSAALPVVGILHAASPKSLADQIASFRRGLREAGYVEGRNVAIEYRSAEERFERLPALAADLVRRRVSVIATPGSTASALAAKAATSTIPIVFGSSDDPVKFGLVASLARPGGNATGINFFTGEVVAKRLGLLRELVPTAASIAVLVNPTNPTNAETARREVAAAARAMGLRVTIVNASSGDEIDAAFAAVARERPDALFVGPDAFFFSRRVQLTALAARYGLPAAYAVRGYVEAGGLMSYGTSLAEMFRQVGVYTGRVLKGEKPADMPVFQLTKFELIINLKTAKALRLAVPESILAQATEVVE